MSAQKSITSFFNSRKRSAVDSTPTRSKLLIQKAEAEGPRSKLRKTDNGPVPGGPAAAQEGPSTTLAKVVGSLSVDDIKKKIQANAAAKEKLKNSLKRFSDLNDKLKIKPFEKPLEFELPESPIKKPAYLSPLKSPSKSSPVKSSSPTKARVRLNFEGEKKELPLPQSYECVYASFKAMVGVACMLENRKESVTLSKVSSGVEMVTRTSFGRERLGQIKTVDPESFECRLLPDDDLELKVNLSKDAQGKAWACLTKREDAFRRKLVELVKKCHHEFLQQLDPPIHIELDQVRRWHPDFAPNLIPEIKPAPLPQSDKAKVYTASEILEANCFLKTNPRVAQALLRQKKVGEEQETQPAEAEAPLNPSLRGLPASLLAKVRQKQAERARLASLSIVRPNEEQQRRRQLERLPALAKYVRNVFVSQKKNVLRLDLLLEKLQACFPCKLTRKELDQHIDLIHEALPRWLCKLTERHEAIVRLDKDAPLDNVLLALEKLLD